MASAVHTSVMLILPKCSCEHEGSRHTGLDVFNSVSTPFFVPPGVSVFVALLVSSVSSVVLSAVCLVTSLLPVLSVPLLISSEVLEVGVG